MTSRLLFVFSSAAALALTGCTVLVDGAINRGGSSSCEGLLDGTACTRPGILDNLVCIRGACVSSTCGDGVLDRRDEQCDDGNPLPDDGCEPDCTPSGGCETDDECPDTGDSCADYFCEGDSGECRVEIAPDGTRCSSSIVDSGTCDTGLCLAAGCGDGVLDPSEQCDDGNLVAGDGCSAFCKAECSIDADCIQDPCFGTQTCTVTMDPTQGTLGLCETTSSPIDCGNPDCAFCDSSSGEAVCLPTATADVDGDGFSSIACGGTDCADDDFFRNPGLTEECDPAGFDSNCDLSDEPTSTRWYADCDADGYGARGADSRVSCERPTYSPPGCGSGTWTSREPVRGAIDCLDSNPDVRPGAGFFATPYIDASGATSFDYNCDGIISPEFADAANPETASCGIGGCSSRPPAPLFPQGVVCGASATLYSCEESLLRLCNRVASRSPVTKRCR
ncbi:MAG: hypothetical protein OHK0013_08510 [Sandaracinaceae bacterium]